MAREIDAKIAEWLGLKVLKLRDYAFLQERYNYEVVAGRTVDNMPNTYPVPNYTTRDSDAILLLPVLVERGYVNSELSYHNMHWWFKIQKIGYNSPVYYAMKPTIAEAISEALVKLIESI